MNILLLMAGSSDAFREAGYIYPKNLIEIQGLPLIQHVLQSLQKSIESLQEQNIQLICMIRAEENRYSYTGGVINLLASGTQVIEVQGKTTGAACTALLAIEYINNTEPLIIINGDQIVETDLVSVINDFQVRDLDGGTIVFEAVHPRWSYVRCNKEDLVVEAAEKRPISNLATAGVYYFAKGQDFVQATMNMIKKDAHVNNIFYVCPSFNEMLLQQAKIGIYKIPREKYFSLASPKGVEFYEEYLRNKIKINI